MTLEWIRLAPGLRIARLPDGGVRVQHVTNNENGTDVVEGCTADVPPGRWVDGVTDVSAPYRLRSGHDRELVRVEVLRIHTSGESE